MAYDHIKTEQLAKKVEERKRFLKKIVNFAENLLLKRGRLIKRVQGSCNTNVKRQLDGFAHFSFFADWGQTMFGGNDVMIWYYPDFKDIDPIKTRAVLHIYYQAALFSVDDCEVKHFDENNEWQNAIERVIKEKKSIVAQITQTLKSSKKQDKAINEKQQKQSQTERDAKRLGI